MLQGSKRKNLKGWAIIFSIFYGLLIMCCILTVYKLQLNFMECSELYCANLINNDYKEDEIQYLRTNFNNYFNKKEFNSIEELKMYLNENAKEIAFTRTTSKLYYNSANDEIYIDITLKSMSTKRYVYRYTLDNKKLILIFVRSEYF